MSAADQIVAFKTIVAEGKSIEDVAARFGITPKVVESRLKLANCADFLIEVLRAERVSLDVLMAFAITDDHEAQRAVWKGLSEWQRNNPNCIRQLLTKDELNTKTDRLAKFVGLKAYEKAGGQVRRDLFSESGESYLQDIGLVQKLATEKLTKVADEIKAAEGWAWTLVTFEAGGEAPQEARDRVSKPLRQRRAFRHSGRPACGASRTDRAGRRGTVGVRSEAESEGWCHRDHQSLRSVGNPKGSGPSGGHEGSQEGEEEGQGREDGRRRNSGARLLG
jgi:hypothetical protein